MASMEAFRCRKLSAQITATGRSTKTAALAVASTEGRPETSGLADGPTVIPCALEVAALGALEGGISWEGSGRGISRTGMTAAAT